MFSQDALLGGQQRNVWDIRFWVAVNKVEDAVRAGVDAGGDARQGNFGLGRGTNFQAGVSALIHQSGQIRHPAGFLESFKDDRVKRVESQNDRSHLLFIFSFIFARPAAEA